MAGDAGRKAGSLGARILGALGTVFGGGLMVLAIVWLEDGRDAGNVLALFIGFGGLLVLMPSLGLLITGRLDALSP